MIYKLMLVFILSFSIAYANEYQKQQPTAFDMARLFMEMSGQIGPQQIDELFKKSIAVNTNIDADYLDVAFYNKETNETIDSQEIRNLMGATRQDGAIELIEIISTLFPNRFPITKDRLVRLMDASYIASMRNPPPYIDIEFFDTRCGPTGVGGGVSGSTPTTRCEELLKEKEQQEESKEEAQTYQWPSSQEFIRRAFAKEQQRKEERAKRWEGIDLSKAIIIRDLEDYPKEKLKKEFELYHPPQYKDSQFQYESVIIEINGFKEFEEKFLEYVKHLHSENKKYEKSSNFIKTYDGKDTMVVLFYAYYSKR